MIFEKSKNNKTSQINLINTKLQIENGTGIHANESIDSVNLNNSKVCADVLLVTKAATKNNNFTFTLNANHSILDGEVSTEKKFKTVFDLQNNTKWALQTSTKKDADGNLLGLTQRTRFDTSVLNINDSFVVFKKPIGDRCHTLHIEPDRSNTKKVYNTTGKAEISFNAEWSDSTAINESKKLIIF
ncbi:hypothetical protein [Bartonella phoceensis]|uniref:hypothetical protein n=1 Tax=Bartonella phoceensis TaxID=270249 RepID=UPI001ABB0F21|nr:hypothetical protein [Bartonella phoceensis]